LEAFDVCFVYREVQGSRNASYVSYIENVKIICLVYGEVEGTVDRDIF
jgi:hypothetical protein